MGSLKFGAFPRSGSHFFTHLTNCEWLDHRIEPLGTEQNVVVSIRNPLQCVPSWITLTADQRNDRAEKVLEWYCAYYEKVKELNVVVLPFEQLISNPLFCVNYAYKKYGIEPLQSLDYDLSTEFHFPTKDKTGYQQIINEMYLAPSFTKAVSLFEELCVPVG
jgi:hypothetical protein